jgi:hypothetical protein
LTTPTTNTLPPTTIVPTNDDLFTPYFNRMYEDIASSVNSKDSSFYAITISDVAADIPGLARFGVFVVCVSGTVSTLPTLSAVLCKADDTAAGAIVPLASQVGTGAWAGNALTITSTATNFQIAHDRAGVSASFNIRVIGTQ